VWTTLAPPTMSAASSASAPRGMTTRLFFIDNLLVRIHFIIVMILALAARLSASSFRPCFPCTFQSLEVGISASEQHGAKPDLVSPFPAVSSSLLSLQVLEGP